ncbi:MAG TPA: hypothetical protein VFV87_13415 [Pirellulaceae bacterium]|nr:hypothetical protein [Pirellulaceae bacterium]
MTDSFDLSATDQTTIQIAASGTLTAILDAAGNLKVTDVSADGVDNDLSLIRSGQNLIVSDAHERFSIVPPGGVLSDGGRTLTLPLALVTGSIAVHLQSGTDALGIEFGDANSPSSTITETYVEGLTGFAVAPTLRTRKSST